MNVEAYILVGGKSSRFGSDKAVASISGLTLAERAYNTVRQALPESPIVFVTGSSEGFSAELKGPVVRDQIENRGPVGGLVTALSNANSEWIFLFACDLPLMTDGFISRMLDECVDEFDAIVPEQPDGRLQSLCAFYRGATVLPAARKLIDVSPNASMMAVIDRLDTRVIKPSTLDETRVEMWINVNRREDLETAEAKIRRKLSPRDSI